MTEIVYPNREHKKADETARRRALYSLSMIRHEAHKLDLLLNNGPEYRREAEETQVLFEHAQKLSGYLAELGTLYDVREWHADKEVPAHE